MSINIKKLSLLLLSAIFSANLWADINPSYNTNATAFAIQAGSIAGAAQACGEDISVFQRRIGEALAVLAQNPQDNVFAMTAFQKAMDHAQQTQRNGQPIPCVQVAQDFNNLPIMRADYQQTVLTQLSPNMGVANPAPNPVQPSNQIGHAPSNPPPAGAFPQATPPQIQQPPEPPTTTFNQAPPASANMTPPPTTNVPPPIGPTNLYNQQSLVNPPHPAAPQNSMQSYPTARPAMQSPQYGSQPQPAPNQFGQPVQQPTQFGQPAPSYPTAQP